MTIWTEAESSFIQDNLHLSTKEIYLRYCDSYGACRSYDSIQKKVKQVREEGLPPSPEDADSENIEQILAEAFVGSPAEHIVIPGATAKEKKETREKAQAWLKDLIDYTKQLDVRIDPIVPIGAGTSLCILISDVHIGKHTDVYNLEIARNRLLSIPEKLRALEDPDRIDEVVVMLIGDLVEGEDIYPTQSSHIECSAIEQVQHCTESIWEMVRRLRSTFNCRVRIESAPGNHGRVSKTANEKTNWDNVVYYILQTLVNMHPDTEIVFTANYNSFHTFHVQDKTGMIYHHGVKHTGTAAMREKVAGWIAARNFDFMCHGHWHEWHVGAWLGKPVVANGCICGPDDLAERMAREDSAKQAYFKVTAGQPLYSFGWLEWEDES